MVKTVVSCPYCDFKADRDSKVDFHLSTRRDDITYKCEQCPFLACNTRFLLIHRRKTHPQEWTFVGSSSRATPAAAETIRKDELEEEEVVEKYRAPDPLEEYSDIEPEEIFPIESNNNNFWNNNDESLPKKNDNEETTAEIVAPSTSAAASREENSKKFQCKYCSYRSNDVSVLDRHVRVHTGEKPFECPFCEFKSAYPSSLKVHVRGHLGEKPFVCSICSHAFTQRAHLKRHEQTHEKEKVPSKTPKYRRRPTHLVTAGGVMIVQSRSSSQADLKPCRELYEEETTKQRPFNCSQCPYSASQSSLLARHMNIHNEALRPFKCSYCPHRTFRASDRNRHEKIHTGK